MKILAFGASGQVGTELAKFPDVEVLSRSQADLSNPEMCRQAIEKSAPQAVINAAAYTAVDKAEAEEALATVINGDAPAAMAGAAAELGIPFVHISTDYVFDGTGELPWRPSDPVLPQNAYGRSKLRGEEAVEKAGGCFAILRTSWVFSSHGNNFVKTMLRLGAERDELSIVDDQIGGPTAAGDIAQSCYDIAHQLKDDAKKGGIYHYSGTADTSWAGFAREIFHQADIECKVHGILTKDYPTPASRPHNSRMDCSKTEKAFGIKQPDWKASLGQVLAELKQAASE